MIDRKIIIKKEVCRHKPHGGQNLMTLFVKFKDACFLSCLCYYDTLQAILKGLFLK